MRFEQKKIARKNFAEFGRQNYDEMLHGTAEYFAQYGSPFPFSKTRKSNHFFRLHAGYYNYVKIHR